MANKHPKVRFPYGTVQKLSQDGFFVARISDAVQAETQEARLCALADGLDFMIRNPHLAPPLRPLHTERDEADRLVQAGFHHNPKSGRWSYTWLLGPDGLDMDDPRAYPTELAPFFSAGEEMAWLSRLVGMQTGVALQRAGKGGPTATKLLREGITAFRYMIFPIIPGIGRSRPEPSTAYLGVLLRSDGGRLVMSGKTGAQVPVTAERDAGHIVVMGGRELGAFDASFEPTRHAVVTEAEYARLMGRFEPFDEAPPADTGTQWRRTAKGYVMVPASARRPFRIAAPTKASELVI